MRYWWVNQNQTFRQEIAGGYLWSPKRNANGARNPFYESMREVSPGDLIFSFVDTRVVAIGIAKSYCWECPKPIEFGSVGQNWESRIEQQIETDPSVNETDREAIVRARRGQGLFKQRVMRIETHCRITGVDNPSYLLASHCKPWRDSSNEERLNGENGLLLTPSIDLWFDRGFIGFEDSGNLIISPVAHKPSLQRMGLETKRVTNVGPFTDGQRQFLEFHRNAILLRVAR